MFVNKSVYLALAACIGLAACSTERLARFPSYKLTIVQGNELDLQAVASKCANAKTSPCISMRTIPWLKPKATYWTSCANSNKPRLPAKPRNNPV